MPDAPDTPGSPKRVLIVRPSALGDVARTVPALASIKRAHPEAEIDWLVRDIFADAVSAHPDLANIISFPRGRLDRFWRSPAAMARVLAYCRKLRRADYDLVIDLQGLLRSGVFTGATRAKRRIGPADARELAWLGYNRWARVPGGTAHTVDRMLAVVNAAGIEPVRDMRLYTSDEHRAWADAIFTDHAIDPAKCVAVAPTAKWASKRWPIERFDATMGALAERGFESALVLGGPGDESATAPLLSDVNAPLKRIDLTAKTSVGQMMAAIERCAFVLANDSAALHIAIGFGRRAVGIYGPTDPAAVGPYRYELGVARPDDPTRVNYRALADDRSVIKGVSIERVIETIDRVLATPPPDTLLH